MAGQVPSDMDGHALFIAGIPYGDGVPLFTGDGMVYRLSFGGGVATIKTRLVRTDDFLVDEAASGDAALAFKSSGMVRMSPAFGARDFANTALVPLGGRLITAYDAGRPWEIDPVTLEMVTPVGLQSVYEPMFPATTPGLGFFSLNMTTAHPTYDADDELLYLVNYVPPVEGLNIQPVVRVLRWDGASEPTATEIVDSSGARVVITQSCHQMQVTKSFVILSDGAFNVEAEQMTGKHVSRAQLSTSVLFIVRKADLVAGGTAVAVRVEIPVECAHFLVDRDDDGEKITVMLAHQNSADPSEWLWEDDIVFATGAPVDKDLVGMMVGHADLAIMGRYTIDARSGRVVSSSTLVDDRLWGATLWTQDPRSTGGGLGEAFWTALGFSPDILPKRIVDLYADHPHRIIPVAELPKSPLPPRLLRIDHDTMTILDEVEMPLGWFTISPTFVPRKNGGPNEGYLVVTALGPEADEFWIFDASDLARGPICRLRHAKLNFGFSLHTAWLPDLVSPPAGGYRVSRSDDYGPRLELLSDKARSLVTSVLGI